jgi:molecular chaperone DnaK (HSP70)
MAKNNFLIGKLELTGILPARHGVPQIEVSFDLDRNGTLKVSASDRNTGKTESITTVTMALDLLGDEIDRMIHIGLKENNIWKKKKLHVSFRNYIFGTKNQVHDENGIGGMIDKGDKKEVITNFCHPS